MAKRFVRAKIGNVEHHLEFDMGKIDSKEPVAKVVGKRPGSAQEANQSNPPSWFDRGKSGGKFTVRYEVDPA